MYFWKVELGRELKTFRKKKGWSQADVRDQTDIPIAVVSKIENGKFVGAISTIEKYMLIARLDFRVVENNDFPQFDELHEIFGED